MKKHVVIPLGVCVLLIVLSGSYLKRKYKMQVEAQKELMVWYISDVKTKLNVITSRIRELPHIVKPILSESDMLNVNIEKKFREEISLFEQFYIDNHYFIRGISVFNINGDVFNLYRDKNGEFIRDIYKSRSINKLQSDMGVVIENNSFSIVMPVYHGQTLSGNVAVILDVLSLQQEIFKPYLENDHLWITSVLDEETLMTFPLDEEWVLSCEKDMILLAQEQKSSFFTGKIKSNESSARVVTYFENMAIPEYYVGIAFSSNISLMMNSSLTTFVMVVVILTFIAAAASFFLNRMIVRNREMLHKKDKEINVLQIIYDNSPVAFIVSRNNRFFMANNYFFKMFEGFASLDDTRSLNLPFKVQQEYKEWDLCTFERMGKEKTLGRRQMSVDLDGDKYAIDAFWNVSEMDQRLKDAIRSKIAKSELLSRVSSDVRKTLNNVRDAATLLVQQMPEEGHLAYINKVTSELSGLVDSVQDYANIEAGKIVLDEMPFNLIDEIKKLTEKYQAEAQKKGIELRAHVASSTIRNVVGDPQRFQQIIDELLNNAIRFTDKGFVRISLETTELQKRKILIKCSVEDTGQGMPKEKLKKLFALDQLVKEQDSIGLGIIIIRKLIQIMGGKLRVSSPSPISTDPSAPGVQFSFSLVCFSDQPHEKNLDYSSIVSYRQINVLIITTDTYLIQYLENFLNRRGIQSDIFIYDKESADLLLNRLIIDKSRYQMVVIATGSSEMSFSIAEDIRRKDLAEYFLYIFIDTHSQRGNYIKAKSLKMDYYFISGNDISSYDSILTTHFPNLSYEDVSITELVREDLQILIADHNELGQMVAQMIFKNLGYEVDLAPDASCLENQMNQKKYDIIFIDLMFPPDDAFKVAEMLRKKKSKIPIIVMTSTLTRENLKRITYSSINGYLSKPLNPDNIKHTLIKWFS